MPLTVGESPPPPSLKCGVLGDPVNLAARLEGLTRRYDSRLLIRAAARRGARGLHRVRGGDPPAKRFAAVTERLIRDGVPDDWDGVERMTEK